MRAGNLVRYEGLLDKYPGLGFDQSALYGAAVSAYKIKELTKAKNYYRKLIEDFKDSAEAEESEERELGELPPNSDDMLTAAREYFRENKYSLAEPLLNQLILKNAKSPEVFHMLGTIYYDQGKFNKAIRAFQTGTRARADLHRRQRGFKYYLK